MRLMGEPCTASPPSEGLHRRTTEAGSYDNTRIGSRCRRDIEFGEKVGSRGLRRTNVYPDIFCSVLSIKRQLYEVQIGL